MPGGVPAPNERPWMPCLLSSGMAARVQPAHRNHHPLRPCKPFKTRRLVHLSIPRFKKGVLAGRPVAADSNGRSTLRRKGRPVWTARVETAAWQWAPPGTKGGAARARGFLTGDVPRGACHSAAPPSTFSRCINSDGESASARRQCRQGFLTGDVPLGDRFRPCDA